MLENPYSFYFIFQANGINLALVDGYVVLTFNHKMWKSKKQYQDGKWHYLTVAKRAGKYERILMTN